jgi:Fic family protein
MPRPFDPIPLPIKTVDHGRLISLVGRANACLARYDGLLRGIVNPSVFLSPLTTQEAVLSSKIEGTQATVDEVLEHEAGEERSGEKGVDIQEILNYRKALALATEHVEKYPIKIGLVLELHRVLMDSVRGKEKNPGAFRTMQNWIGKPNCTIEEATYIPPSPLRMIDHLQNWEAYILGSEFDTISQVAFMHAQFEMIHPFMDGNGRVGRLLIPLFLYSKNVISSPNFYISQYLEIHRETYYERLGAISREGDWNGWQEFFLQAVIAQSENNARKVEVMLMLYNSMKEKIVSITHSQHAIRILDAIFEKPIFKTSDFSKLTGIPKQSVFPLLKKLKDEDVLEVVKEPSGRRAGIMAFPALLNITE